MERLIVAVLILIIAASILYAEELYYENIAPQINCKEFNCVTTDPNNPNTIYIGTSDGAYKTEDGYLKWKRIFTGWSTKKNVRSIYLKDSNIYLCTDGGLYISTDGGVRWNRSYGIAARWRIYSVAVIGKDQSFIIIATDRGLFKSSKDKNGWTRIFFGTQQENGDEYLEIEDEGEAEETQLPITRAVAGSSSNLSRIYLGTDDGIFISEDEGRLFTRLTDEGLLDKKIDFIMEAMQDAHKLYAATKNGLFYFDGSWHSFSLDRNIEDIKSFAFFLKEGKILLAAKRGVYKIKDIIVPEKRELETQDDGGYKSDEPTINEVQDKAIMYAEVHPDKIAGWRRRANMSAILPEVSLGIDNDKSNTYEIYTSSSAYYTVEGPTRDRSGWDIRLTWDLGDLIWSGAQTTIDIRSRLMVQLRDDILDEVTSYYFERRRLQVELKESPLLNSKDRVRKELRLQELTANIDAMTGGWFSRELKKRREGLSTR